MEKLFIVISTVFVLYNMIGLTTNYWSRFAAGVEVLGYFDDPDYDPSEKQFSAIIKKLEHERRVPRWWVLGASISLVTMTSGVFVPISELGQVLNASLALIVGSLVINIVLYIAEQVVVDSLRKKRVDRYASKLADPQF